MDADGIIIDWSNVCYPKQVILKKNNNKKPQAQLFLVVVVVSGRSVAFNVFSVISHLSWTVPDIMQYTCVLAIL